MRWEHADEWARGKGYLDYDDYNSAQIRRNKMKQQFKLGDKIRLKDSSYEGVVSSTVAGMVSFKVTNSKIAFAMTVSDPTVLEHVFDPKPGDVYRDKNGREWAIRESMSSYSTHESYRLAILLDPNPKNRETYPYTQMLLQKPEKIAGWAERYKPELVRRRDS
jgi:hypothetical protein